MENSDKLFYIAHAVHGIPQELVYWYTTYTDAQDMAYYIEEIEDLPGDFLTGFTDYKKLQHDIENNVFTLEMECDENDLKFKKIVEIENDVIPHRRAECLEFCGDFISLEDAVRTFEGLENGLRKFFAFLVEHQEKHDDNDSDSE